MLLYLLVCIIPMEPATKLQTIDNICLYLQVILKLAEISAMVKGLDKDYSVIIKVLPTDDNERYKVKHKFRQLLKFSKEVQVYMKIIKCMYM